MRRPVQKLVLSGDPWDRGSRRMCGGGARGGE